MSAENTLRDGVDPAGVWATPEWFAARDARRAREWRPDRERNYDIVLEDLRRRRALIQTAIEVVATYCPSPTATAPDKGNATLETSPEQGSHQGA